MMPTTVNVLILHQRDHDEVLVFSDRDRLMAYWDRHQIDRQRFTLQIGTLDPDPNDGQATIFG